MDYKRLKQLQLSLQHPLLIKKKENLLYLTGRSFMHGYLLVKPRNHADSNAEPRGKLSVVFFGDGLEKVEGMKSDRLKNIPLYLAKAHTLELEDQFTFAEYNYIKAKLRNPHPGPLPKGEGGRGRRKVKIEHQRSPVDFQRQVKDSNEIAMVRKSMQIVGQVFGQVKQQLGKRSWTEVGLAEFIKSSGLKLGAEDVSFPPIVASGANAAVPHHVPSLKKLKPGESIIIDFGFKYKNYCSDFTRTVFLKNAPKKLSDAYNQVEKAYNESINFVSLRGASATKQSQSENRLLRSARNDKIAAGDVYQKSVDVLTEKHLQKYFIHSLGHGTGLEIHELPNLSPGSKDILKNNMVFSIEPGVYIPKLGGIRIEDLVYLESGKVKKFISIPTNLKYNII